MPSSVKGMVLPASLATSFLVGYLSAQVRVQAQAPRQTNAYKRGMVYIAIEKKMLNHLKENAKRRTLALISRARGPKKARTTACLVTDTSYRLMQTQPYAVLEVRRSELGEIAPCFNKPAPYECEVLSMAEASHLQPCKETGRIIYGEP